MARKNRESYNEYMKVYLAERYASRRAQATASLGGACAHCGETERLDFDHVDPTTKVNRIAKLLLGPMIKLQAELAKCQLLCKPCHIDKTRADQLAT